MVDQGSTRLAEAAMRQSKAFLQVAGELVSIVVLALTARFIGFTQSTLESGVPLSVDRAIGHFTDILSVFTRVRKRGAVAVGTARCLAHSYCHCLRQPLGSA
jgi:hypothetical protein